jgi:hypothetical protein
MVSKKQKVFRKNFIYDFFYYFMLGIIPPFFVVTILYPAKIAQAKIPYDFYSWVSELPFWCRLAVTLVLGGNCLLLGTSVLTRDSLFMALSFYPP